MVPLPAAFSGPHEKWLSIFVYGGVLHDAPPS
jgi:hypothetical protein